MNKKYIIRIFRVTAAIIVLQTLRFKFTGQPESVMLFTQLGAEPYGRIASGMIELIGGILILVPKTSKYGAMIICGVMCGAIYFHITVLGYNSLFLLACVALISSALVLCRDRNIFISQKCSG